MQYRPEIDGLRALAVLPVVLFHAGVPGFAGGFVGVDVFFVISGYLITSIIAADLEADRFSVATFYERRARRILPALFFVALVTFPLAWLWMMPSQLKDYSQTLVGVSTFSANVLFYFKSGYFEPSLELNPMLHTWSLAVEEQYYVVFPPLMLSMRRWSPGAVRCALGALTIASFASAQWMSTSAPTANYYLATGRIWELLVGALIALTPEQRRANDRLSGPAAVAGALSLLGSLVFIDSTTPFPSAWALFPVGGSALLIRFASSENLVGRILSRRFLVGIGLISYSTYLWHQPLFALARLRSLDEPGLTLMIGLGAASFVLGHLTWRWVEAPLRDKTRIGRSWIAVGSAGGLGFLVAVGIVGHATGGFASLKYRIAGSAAEQAQSRLGAAWATRDHWERLLAQADAPFEPAESGRVLILGDSLSEDLYVALVLNQERFLGHQFRRLVLDDLCMKHFAREDVGGEDECSSQARSVLGHPLLQQADLLVVTAGWDRRSADQVDVLLDRLKDRRVVVVGTAAFAEMSSLLYRVTTRSTPRSAWPSFFAHHMHLSSRDASKAVDRVVQRHGMRFVDKYDAFCDRSDVEVNCELIDEDGLPIIVDQSHVSLAGAMKLGRIAAERRWLVP